MCFVYLSRDGVKDTPMIIVPALITGLMRVLLYKADHIVPVDIVVMILKAPSLPYLIDVNLSGSVV